MKTSAQTLAQESAAFTPRLRPRLHENIQSFLATRELVFALADQFGSPLNIVFPDHIQENAQSFQDTYKKHKLRGDIYFTSKPCKSLALYRAASELDIKIDVSSAGSLTAVMGCGWTPNRVGATGPKNKSYIQQALQHNVLLNVDNLNELKQIFTLSSGMGLKARITLRIADYGSSRVSFMSQDDTTFGIRSADIPWAISYLKEHSDTISFEGFSYHASMASDEQRIAAMENQLNLTFTAISQGLKPQSINIGGGFAIDYAESAQEWTIYTGILKESVLGKVPSQTWNNNGLGYRVENGAIRGGAAYINHAPAFTKGQELDRWLSFRLPSMGNVVFSDIVRDSLLTLSIEPGRAMLDQCGITLGRVSFLKPSGNGENLAGLDMNRSNLHSNHFKQLTEPMVIPRGSGIPNTEGQGFYYVGNLCLSFDMLQYNKTYPTYLPEEDDLIAFANTAAYMMDFTESETLMQRTAQKIALTYNEGNWSHERDEDYRRQS